MKKEKEVREQRLISSGSVDVRTLLGSVFFMGFIFLLTQSMLRVLKSPCRSSIEDTIPSPLPTATAKLHEKEPSPSSTVAIGEEEKPTTMDHRELSRPLDYNASAEGRKFRAYGLGAYLFVEFGTYRGGPDSFAVIGLASKSIHVFGKPTFECEWIPNSNPDSDSSRPITGKATKILPDWGFGRVYTVVVVNCSFPHPVGADGNGGRLILHASPGHGYGHNETFVTLEESPSEYQAYVKKKDNGNNYPYEFVYCGSPLFGSINPSRIREWVAYHAKLFGPRSLMLLYDAGGITERVRNALAPWIQSGHVAIENIRQQEQYDGYYHNQFLIANDCLHRSRFLARWAFYFDVDEYLYIPPKTTLQSVMKELSNYTQITYEQAPMSNQLCLAKDKSRSRRQWGFEKLVFQNVKRNVRYDRKYVIQPWAAMATGVHLSLNVVGQKLHSYYPKLKYYHYHNTISNFRELCKVYVSLKSKNDTFYYENEPYRLDTGMQSLALDAKLFEVRHLRRSQSALNGTA